MKKLKPQQEVMHLLDDIEASNVLYTASLNLLKRLVPSQKEYKKMVALSRKLHTVMGKAYEHDLAAPRFGALLILNAVMAKQFNESVLAQIEQCCNEQPKTAAANKPRTKSSKKEVCLG